MKVQYSLIQVQHTKMSKKEVWCFIENVYITINNNKQYFIETVCNFWSWAYLYLFAGGRGAERRNSFLPNAAPFLLDFAFLILDFALFKMLPSKYAYGSGCEYNYEF